MSAPERREALRDAICRSCDCVIGKGVEMITLYSMRNRGQNIHFCLPCASHVGDLAE